MTSTTTARTVRVLILCDVARANATEDPDSAEALLGSEPGLQLTTRAISLGRAAPVARSVRADVILLDCGIGDPVDLVTELDEALPATPVLVLIDRAEQDRVNDCVAAGARGCVVRPFQAVELTSTILQVHERALRRRQLQLESAPPGPSAGRIVVVRGTKGGVGATALATNIAVAVRQRAKQPTAIVDGHFFGGDVPVALNVVHDRSLLDLLPHVGRFDDDLFDATLAKHASGVAVLPAPAEFEQVDAIRSEDYQDVLNALRARFAWVVVDCSPVLDRNTLTAMDMADVLLLVTTPEIAALKNAGRLLRLGMQLGYSDQKVRLVLNRSNMPGAIRAADFEQHLDRRIAFRIPNDGAVGRALTNGEPVVTFQSTSSAARALNRLATTLVTNGGWQDEMPARSAPARRFALRWPGLNHGERNLVETAGKALS